MTIDASDGRIWLYGLACAELSIGEERFDCSSCNTDIGVVSVGLDRTDARIERIITAAVERSGVGVGALADGMTAFMQIVYDIDESATDRLFDGRSAIVSFSGR